MKYWAIDYVDDRECELVLDDQLYATELDAIEEVMDRLDRDNLEVTMYTLADLQEDVYVAKIIIDENLKVQVIE